MPEPAWLLTFLTSVRLAREYCETGWLLTFLVAVCMDIPSTSDESRVPVTAPREISVLGDLAGLDPTATAIVARESDVRPVGT